MELGATTKKRKKWMKNVSEQMEEILKYIYTCDILIALLLLIQ